MLVQLCCLPVLMLRKVHLRLTHIFTFMMHKIVLDINFTHKTQKPFTLYLLQ